MDVSALAVAALILWVDTLARGQGVRSQTSTRQEADSAQDLSLTQPTQAVGLEVVSGEFFCNSFIVNLALSGTAGIAAVDLNTHGGSVGADRLEST